MLLVVTSASLAVAGGGSQHKLRWCTKRRRLVVDLWLALAAAAIVGGRWSVARGTATAGTADRAGVTAY